MALLHRHFVELSTGVKCMWDRRPWRLGFRGDEEPVKEDKMET